MQVYEGAMYEISTKLEILDSEFQVRFSHNPIHHMERRLKSINSILGKLRRKDLPLTVESVKDNLFDVAGIRVICNYRDDVYSVSNYLSAQNDIQACDLCGSRFSIFRTALHACGGAVPHHRHGLLGEFGACAAL